jgi:hypothetical protein
MSITTIARQAQGMRAGQVIAKLAEDAYFMRVNTRVAQPPPVRNRDNEGLRTTLSLLRYSYSSNEVGVIFPWWF